MTDDVSKKSEHAEAPGALDLGLSFLLNAEEPSHAAPSVPPSAPSQEAVPPSVPFSEQQSLYEKLAASSSWSEILRLAEGDLGAGDDPRVRTWWIYAHLQNRSMPASFLAAPLESLLAKNTAHTTAESAHSNQQFLERTAHLVHRRLVESGDVTLAHAIAASISSAHLSPTAEERHPLGSPSLTPLLTDAPSTGHDETRVSSPIWGAEAVHRPLQFRYLGVVAVGLFCLVVAAATFFAFGGKQLFGAEVAIAAESFVSQNESPELLIPALDRRDLVGRLGALYYSIDTPGAKSEEERGDRAVGKDVDSVAVSGTGEPAAVLQPALGAGADVAAGTAGLSGRMSDPKPAAGDQQASPSPVTPKLPKERVNTSSPVEGPEFRDRANRTQGSSSRGGGTSNHPRPGQEEGRNRRAPSESPRPEIIMGMPEPDVVKGRYYTVLVSCSVLDAPNYSALVVSQLRRGETVFVEARVGGWLRLRSRNGRGGFVMAQDLVEASQDDFRQP